MSRPQAAAVEKIGSLVVMSPGQNLMIFHNIPQTYRHLRLIVVGRCDGAVSLADVLLYFNQITAAAHDQELIFWAATTLSVFQAVNATSIDMGSIAGASAAANNAGAIVGDILNYANEQFFKSFVGMSTMTQGSGAGNIIGERYSGQCRGTTRPITRIDLQPSSGNWVVGSFADLYGVT